MRAGSLDRRVELRHRSIALDSASGQQVERWPTAYAIIAAGKRDVRGKEYFAAQQINGDLMTVFTIRYRKDVLMTDQIVCEGLAYNIHSIAEVGRRVALEITATAVRT